MINIFIKFFKYEPGKSTGKSNSICSSKSLDSDRELLKTSKNAASAYFYILINLQKSTSFPSENTMSQIEEFNVSSPSSSELEKSI